MPVGRGQGGTSHMWDKIFPTAVQSPGGEVSSLESDVWKVGLCFHSVASKSGSLNNLHSLVEFGWERSGGYLCLSFF